MITLSEDTNRVIKLLTNAPDRIRKVTHGVKPAQLYVRSNVEPWSVNDILAHLRACSDSWGKTIFTMLAQDNPVQRYVSPRSLMRKPAYADQEFDVALDKFTIERRKLVDVLSELDATGWARRGTLTGVSARQRDQTVLSFSERIVNHEQPHLDQIESLLR